MSGMGMWYLVFFFFQAEDGIRDAQESRGLGDVYKRQGEDAAHQELLVAAAVRDLDRAAEDEGEQQHEHDLSLIHI